MKLTFTDLSRFDLRASGAIRRLSTAGKESRARRRELNALHNLAYKAEEAAKVARPRLVIPPPPPPPVAVRWERFAR